MSIEGGVSERGGEWYGTDNCRQELGSDIHRVAQVDDPNQHAEGGVDGVCVDLRAECQVHVTRTG